MKLARLADTEGNYGRLKIEKHVTKPWEDGKRSNGAEGTYEWWYIDAEFEDGMTIVSTFYSKNGFDVPGPAHPKSTLDITYPDGMKVTGQLQGEKGVIINAAKDKCHVVIGTSSLEYREGKYFYDYEDDVIKYHVVMESLLPMWRPETGHWYFGKEDKDFFAWFVAQPSSKITGTLEINGKSQQVTGTGYHDHNWGNISMEKVIDHWYWGRAKIGSYDVITCDIISAKKYGYTRLPVMMIGRNGEILEDDQSKTIIERGNTVAHKDTGKFFDNQLRYVQHGNDGTTYNIECNCEKDIVYYSFLEGLSPLKRNLAKMVGANPTYLRVLGEVSIEVEKEGEKEKIVSEGLWEQMFFGSNKHAVIKN